MSSLDWRLSRLVGARTKRRRCVERGCPALARFPDGRCGAHTTWLPDRQRALYEFEGVWRHARHWLLELRGSLEWLTWSEFRDRARALAIEWDEASPDERQRGRLKERLLAARVGPHHVEPRGA